MTNSTPTSTVGDSLTGELERRYGTQLAVEQIAGFVAAVLNDLGGSVAVATLPETPAKLAMLRVDRFSLHPASRGRAHELGHSRG